MPHIQMKGILTMVFLAETILTFAINEGLSRGLSALSPELDEKIRKAIISATKVTLKKLPPKGTDRGNIEDALVKETNELLDSQMTSMEILDEIKQKIEKFVDDEKIDPDWINHFNDNCMREFAKDEESSRYMVLAILNENKEKEQRMVREYQALIQTFMNYIYRNRKGNIYEGLEFLEGTVEPFVIDRLRPSSVPSSCVIELAYGLSDIYDKTNQGARLEKLANKLLDVLANSKVPLSKDRLQKAIGMTYSLTQVERDDINKKKEDLENAEKAYEKIAAALERYDKELDSENDHLFLEGLFKSNYGALWLKKFDIDNEPDYIKKAIDNYKEALSCREALYSALKDSCDELAIKAAEKRVYQSKNNLASAYYRAKDYDNSLKLHKEVLEYRERNNFTYDIYLSKKYIAGCLIEICKREKNLTEDGKATIGRYLEDCIEYYSDNEIENEYGRKIRLEDCKKSLEAARNLSKNYSKEMDDCLCPAGV